MLDKKESQDSDLLSSKVSFSKMTESLLKKKLLIDESDAPPPQKNKLAISFLDEGELNSKKLPRQVYDLLVESIPNVSINLGIFYYNFINMFFVKQIGDALLVASFGMGVTWFNTTSLSILISFGSGLFIQLAQAYGAKNFKLMGELYQRSQAIEFAVGLVSSFFLYNTEGILLFFGIDDKVSSLTSKFAIACIPSVFGSILYDTTKQLLISQNEFDIPMKVQLVVYFVHPIWCFILSSIFDFGLVGIGIARTLSEFLGYFLLAYIIKKKHLCDEIWNLPYDYKSMFKEWIPFMKITIPVGCLVFLEWVFFELQTILVGRLNNEKVLAGQVSFTSMVMFFYMVPLGLSYTQNSYLGNAVGEGKKKVCQNLSQISMATCLAEVAIMFVIGFLLKDIFAGIITTDSEMEYYFRYVYDLYLYTFLLGDYFQVILNGILRCCDLQNYAAYSYFFVYYFVGLPLTYVFTFILDMGIGGVWLSQSLSATAVSVIFYLKIKKIDWDDSIHKVQQRVKEEKLHIDEELHKIQNKEIETPLHSPKKQSHV